MIDGIDPKIFKIVQQNNRLTVDQLGAEVGLSPSACQRRLIRLRKYRVIRADVAIVDSARVGMKLTMIIDVTLEKVGEGVEAVRFEGGKRCRSR